MIPHLYFTPISKHPIAMRLAHHIRNICFIMLICSCMQSAHAQQIEYDPNQNDYLYASPATRYEDRYMAWRAFNNFTVGNTSFYKKNNIKKVEIRNQYDVIQFVVELDTSGTITLTGYPTQHYFYETSSQIVNNNTNLYIQRYFKDGKLVVIDSLFTTHPHYSVKDTTIGYDHGIRLVYKRGDEINQQNRFFNEKYLNKRLQINSCFSLGSLEENQPKVYLRKALPTDFDSLTIYPCERNEFAHLIWGSTDDGNRELNVSAMQDHAFVRTYHEIGNRTICRTDGAWFEEPYDCPNQYYDGYYNHGHNNYRDDGLSYGSTRLDNGLYESYYQDFYPPDTSAEGKLFTDSVNLARFQNNNINPQIIIPNDMLWSPEQQYTKRLEQPIRTVLFRYRYEYFDDTRK